MKREFDLSIDVENNVAYLTLAGGRSYRQTILDRMGLVVDWDGEGGIAGIEFLAARAQLGRVWDDAIKENT